MDLSALKLHKLVHYLLLAVGPPTGPHCSIEIVHLRHILEGGDGLEGKISGILGHQHEGRTPLNDGFSSDDLLAMLLQTYLSSGFPGRSVNAINTHTKARMADKIRGYSKDIQ